MKRNAYKSQVAHVIKWRLSGVVSELSGIAQSDSSEFPAAPLPRYLQQPGLEQHRPHTSLGWNKLFYRKSNHTVVFWNTEVPPQKKNTEVPLPSQKNYWRCLTSDSKSTGNLSRHSKCNRFPPIWVSNFSTSSEPPSQCHQIPSLKGSRNDKVSHILSWFLWFVL